MADEDPHFLGMHYSLEIEGKTIGYFTECSGLAAEYETFSYSEGGQNSFVHQLPGHLRYSNVTLTRGLTSSNAMLDWLFEKKERPQRETVTIKLMDRNLTVVKTWAFSCAVPVKYTGPKVSTDGTGMALESLEFAHEGLVPGVS